MGAFCIYGISRSVCQARAQRDTPAHNISQNDWAARVKRRASELFEQGKNPVKVSPEFDAPQFCRDWLAVAPAEVRLAQIMVRGGQERQAGQQGYAQRRAGADLAVVRGPGPSKNRSTREARVI